mmetsp:Transcript_27705/g.61116  ORF Transcript_27705/g.61116 Transcript_27705/m.61116 type:complete len:428 (+) Transcript_27705:1915-3198(+)
MPTQPGHVQQRHPDRGLRNGDVQVPTEGRQGLRRQDVRGQGGHLRAGPGPVCREQLRPQEDRGEVRHQVHGTEALREGRRRGRLDREVGRLPLGAGAQALPGGLPDGVQRDRLRLRDLLGPRQGQERALSDCPLDPPGQARADEGEDRHGGPLRHAVLRAPEGHRRGYRGKGAQVGGGAVGPRRVRAPPGRAGAEGPGAEVRHRLPGPTALRGGRHRGRLGRGSGLRPLLVDRGLVRHRAGVQAELPADGRLLRHLLGARSGQGRAAAGLALRPPRRRSRRLARDPPRQQLQPPERRRGLRPRAGDPLRHGVVQVPGEARHELRREGVHEPGGHLLAQRGTDSGERLPEEGPRRKVQDHLRGREARGAGGHRDRVPRPLAGLPLGARRRQGSGCPDGLSGVVLDADVSVAGPLELAPRLAALPQDSR